MRHAHRAKRRFAFDAFISHASQQSTIAKRLVRALEADSQSAWIDARNVGVGKLLRPELHDAISTSRLFVLLWSKAASRSRWVMAELFVAFHLKKFIVPCVLDNTPLPQFLGNAVYLDRRRPGTRLSRDVAGAVRAAPRGPTKVAPVILGRTNEIESRCEQIGAGQYRIMAAVTENFPAAEKDNDALTRQLQELSRRAPADPLVVTLKAYQDKNTYLLKYWHPIQACKAPKDRLLARAERQFFDVLCVNPSDFNAINGLGTILFFERELQAAAFFQRRAVAIAKKRGLDYTAAKLDLENTLRYLRQQP